MATGSQLRVPVALDDDGHEIEPTSALAGARYRCASCLGEVIVKGGSRRTHFAHRCDPTVCDFLNETEEHWRAKMRLCEIISAGTPLQIERKCSQCRTPTLQTVLTGGWLAVPEFVLETNHRVDVAAIAGQSDVRLVIEVYATHRVAPAKAQLLGKTPWIEVHADQVLRCDAAAPVLYPINPASSSAECGKCIERREFESILPFRGQHLMRVPCPLKQNAHVIAVDSCTTCAHYTGADEAGIRCLGRRAVDETC